MIFYSVERSMRRNKEYRCTPPVHHRISWKLSLLYFSQLYFYLFLLSCISICVFEKYTVQLSGLTRRNSWPCFLFIKFKYFIREVGLTIGRRTYLFYRRKCVIRTRPQRRIPCGPGISFQPFTANQQQANRGPVEHSLHHY